VLAPTRRAAGALRRSLGLRLGHTVTAPIARTPHSLAFGLLRRSAALAGDPAPLLVSGPEQDRVLAELLAGHAAGQGHAPDWPADVAGEVLGLRGFRDELRDLLMRALERGLTPLDLDDLGRRYDRPQWRAGAQLLAEYLDVTALSTPGAYDPAGIVDAAASALAAGSEPGPVAPWSLVALDDAQDGTAATFRLLDQLVAAGADLLLVGDPDATTQGFRGADPRLLAGASTRYRRAGGPVVPTVVLGTAWRQRAAVRAAAGRVAGRIGTAGVSGRHRSARAGRDGGCVQVHVLASASQETAFVAQLLRRAHLVDGVPWSALAVVVRASSRGAAVRRGLSAAGVPVSVPASEVPLRDEAAVRPLRRALEVVVDPPALDAAAAGELLCSPLGGADPVALRRLRRALRAQELAAGGERGPDALLVAALGEPGLLAAVPPAAAAPARRLARVLQAGRAAREDGGTVEEVLWAVWDATGLAAVWRRAALAGGPAGARADADLDAVMALFEAAGRFADRFPRAGLRQFTEHLAGQDVPADSLAEQAPDDDTVTVTTPQGVAGGQWHTVVVAGVQDGVWPDLRLRGSLLGSQDLVDVLSGRSAGAGATEAAAARRDVLDDELRSFHVALSRATSRLVLTAVDDEEQRPSPLLDLVDPPPAGGGDAAPRPLTQVPRSLDLRALVAELRQELVGESPERAGVRVAAARQLARLARAGVPGASPEEWFALAATTDDGPLRDGDEPVEVSPSRVESFARCGLRWLLESHGGSAGPGPSQGLGSLVHAVAADEPTGTAQALRARLEQLWPTLGLPEGWASDKARERAEQMLDLLAAHTRASGREVVAVEQDFTARVGRAVLRGRVDRLERDEHGRLVVVDLKTGTSAPAAAEVLRHPQLGAYQLAVAAGALSGPGAGAADDEALRAASPGGAALLQLGGRRRAAKEQVQPPLGEDPQPQWASDLLAQVADGMAASVVQARENDLCRVCPVRRCCPLQAEGRQVAQ
jgi:superfamily I DNA/RNA helicase/RecB family exonuclease